MNLDINQILNNPKTNGVVTALPQGLNIAQMGLDRLTAALNYNPYNVSIQKQSFNGKPLMGNGGKVKKKSEPKYSWGNKQTLNSPKEQGTTLDTSNKGTYIDSNQKLTNAIMGVTPLTAMARNFSMLANNELPNGTDWLDLVPLKGIPRAVDAAYNTQEIIDAADLNKTKDLPVTVQKGNGGTLDNNSFDGATHAEGGIDVNENGTPTEINPVAEVEDGEYKYTDPKTKETYIFSNRLPYKYKK